MDVVYRPLVMSGGEGVVTTIITRMESPGLQVCCGIAGMGTLVPRKCRCAFVCCVVVDGREKQKKEQRKNPTDGERLSPPVYAPRVATTTRLHTHIAMQGQVTVREQRSEVGERRKTLRVGSCSGWW